MKLFVSSKTVISCLLIVFFIGACRKNDNANDNCRLAALVVYDSRGKVADSVSLYYENNRIVHVKHIYIEYDIKYINNQVSLIEEPYRGNPLYAGFHDTVYYSSEGKIDSIVNFMHDGPSISFRLNGTYFRYDKDGIPIKIIRTNDDQPNSDWEYDYTVTQGNITQAVGEFDLTGPATRHFSYDNKINYLKSFPKEFYFVSLKVFGVLNSSGQEMAPFNFSRNNVTDYNGIPVTYHTDGNGRLIELNVGTKYKFTYKYECP